ncbi:MAG: YafY family transcriptional regulator [Dysgonamonadaceae bacterium]|jgi:predicted DNA-binding transcriptional regulator YafY|nr:YafY family transcriptional regulator [Dysgonamonadaceae bacterium]
MNRLERISAILVSLQSRNVITAGQIAERFGISMRTVYRDIRVLEEAGVPICGEAGLGYSLVQGFKLPPLMFSTEEAIAFLMAEKLVSNQSDGDTLELYRSGMDKIRAVLKTAEKNILEDFDQHIQLIEFHNSPRQEPANILQPLLKAILDKKAITIQYFAAYNNQLTNRTVEPQGIFYMTGSWYLLAWCKLRSDYRTFNLGRICSLIAGDSGFEKEHPSLKILIDTLYCVHTTYKIRIKILENDALHRINWGKYAYGFCDETEENGYIIQTYKTDSLDYFARWYLSFADKATILEPEELRVVARELVEKIKL